MATADEPGLGECDLRFLMVNGGSFNMRFPPTATISDVKQALIDTKPRELIEYLQISVPGSAPPTKTEELRILHLGKFLEDAKTLQECQMQDGPGNVTTVHISCRVPTAVLDDVKGKLDKKTGTCCCVM